MLGGLANRWRRVAYATRGWVRDDTAACPIDFDGSLAASRELFDHLMDRLLGACWDERAGYFRAPGACQRSPGGARSDAFELAARSFLGAAFALRHGHRQDLLPIYRRAISSGARPDSRYSWRRIRGRQNLVENASIALGLLLNRRLWDSLEDATKAHLLRYFDECSREEFHRNNWLWFKVFHHLFLGQLGERSTEPDIRATLEILDGFYEGEGWYTDGRPPVACERRYDHYNAWAMHFYALLFCRLTPDGWEERKEVLRERARAFYSTYRHLFAADGLPIPWGRSLIYRFAMLGFFGLYVAEGLATPTDLRFIKRIVVSTMRGFLSERILDGEGLLSLGYFRPSGALLEWYSGAGSPYWAFKFFSFFLLDRRHPYWTAPAEAAAEAGATHAIRNIGLTVASAPNGHRLLLNGGTASETFTWKYGKFAYSNTFLQTLDPRYADHALVFLHRGRPYTRDVIYRGAHGPGGVLHTHWTCRRLEGLHVHSTLVPVSDGYVLVSELVTPVAIRYRYAGFNLRRVGLTVRRTAGTIELRSKTGVSRLHVFGGPNAGRFYCRRIPPRRSLDGRHSALPVYQARAPAGRSRMIFCVQAARGGRVEEGQIAQQGTDLRLRVGDSEITMRPAGLFWEPRAG